MSKRECGEGCKGCMFRKKVGGAGVSVCDYSCVTGKLRGCPAGEGCIRYQNDKGKRYRKYLAEFA